MGLVQLGYGAESVSLSYSDDRFQVISKQSMEPPPLSDAAINAAFDHPIESPSLSELVTDGDSVLIVVSDATRATASGQVVNLLVRRLIENGVSPSQIAIVFATGIHRHVTVEEKRELLTPFIAQRINTIAHEPSNPERLITLGTTTSSGPVEVNRALIEFDRVIITGSIAFHYFAGFTGGRKSICPGLASAETIRATHMLALDFENGGRRRGVGPGLLEGNPVHEECVRIAEMINPTFAINSHVDLSGRAVGIFAGDWRKAHQTACAQYFQDRSIAVADRRDLVIVSCGGLPYDINLIQAHKALDMASTICREGGTIILLAQCRDGLGRSDFLKWFAEGDSSQLEQRLKVGYEVNGQTAWALLTKAERYKVFLVSDLNHDDVKRMRLIPANSVAAAVKQAGDVEGYIMPHGAALLPWLSGTTGNSHQEQTNEEPYT